MSIHFPLETSRLVLRDLVQSDWQDIHSYASDPEVVRYLPFGPNTEDDTKNYLQAQIKAQRKRNRQHFTFAMALKEDKQLVGTCYISITDPNMPEGCMGYSLIRKFWGQGYATEASQKLLEFGFNELKLHRIFATCDPRNNLSARVLVKIGMRQEGYLKEYELIKGEWQDRLLYAIIEKDWIQMMMRTSFHLVPRLRLGMP